MAVSLKTDLRFPESGQHGHGSRIIHLNNEKLEFDYEKFELIDTGVKYLNPKHFSVKSFVKYCRFSKE